MSDAVAAQLDELARADPTSAPLARLQAEVLRAAADPAWARGLPDLDAARPRAGLPLLHDQTLRADRDQARRLLDRLASVAERDGQPHAPALRHALAAAPLDPLALLAATICQDADALLALTQDDLDPALLATLGHLLAIPLLRACGERATRMLADLLWDAGYCPVCAAWPTLAELRGLERDHWLRCARCGTGWQYPHHRCAYCGSQDHRRLGYLAAEAQRESRRAVTCDACHGYLKTLATIGPLPPADLALQDLLTLELDLAAIDRGYSRPTAPGFPLRVIVEPLARAGGWLAWRR